MVRATNYENQQERRLSLANLDRGFTFDPVFNEAVVNPMNDARPREIDFMEKNNGPYPAAKVKADLAEIRRIKNSPSFDNQISSSGNALEAATAFLISNKKYNILGEDADARLVSKFDDFKRGCDVAVSLFNQETEENPILFALDVKTCGEKPLTDKLLETLEALDNDYCNSLEYYVNQNEEMVGHVDLPYFLFHMPAESVNFLQAAIITPPEKRNQIMQNEIAVFQADFVDKIKMQAREMILYILAKKIILPDNISDQDLLKYFEENMSGEVAKRLSRPACKNIRMYLDVFEWMLNFQKKNKLPAVGDLVTTFFDAHFVQMVKDEHSFKD